jgi:hypothetical protein
LRNGGGASREDREAAGKAIADAGSIGESGEEE